MKKNFFSMAIFAIVILLSSCSSKSSFESDVKKMANYRCDIEKLMAKDQNDEKVKKDLEKLSKEMQEFGEKMEKKYESKKNDKAMEEQADKIMDEIMAKCK